MTKKEIVVQQELISAQETARFIQFAMQYRSALCITHQSSQVNPKSMMGMLCLGLRPGMKITISGEGDDENTAVDHLGKYLS